MNNSYAYNMNGTTLYISIIVENGFEKLSITTDAPEGTHPRWIGEMLYNAFISMNREDATAHANLYAEMTNVKYDLLMWIEKSSAQAGVHSEDLMPIIANIPGYRKVIPFNQHSTHTTIMDMWNELSWNSIESSLI